MAKAEIDMKDIAGKFTLDVKVHRVNQWAWRVKLAILLCQLAAWIAWLDWSITSSENLWPYKCSRCGFGVAGKKPLPTDGIAPPDEFAINCNHCGYQFLAIWGVKEGHPIEAPEDYELSCGYECGFNDYYGFVPEAGCPIHD